jgi:FMN reductase
MSTPKVVGISGNFTRPSRTFKLVEVITAKTAAALGQHYACFDLLDAGPTLGGTYARSDAQGSLDRVLSEIEQSSALIVGSPVYKASYAGLLKHLFDVLDMNALRGRPIIVAATGKAPEHALMIDHQFRPLFAFFQSNVVPTGVFVTDVDYTAEGHFGDKILKQIDAASAEVLRLVLGANCVASGAAKGPPEVGGSGAL